MAKTWYKPGSWDVICERTGFKVKASSIREEWTGRMVRSQSWEPRHPLDFLQGIPDDPSTPWSRPRPARTYIEADLLAGRFWEFGGYWTPLSGTSWQLNTEWTNDLINLRPDSMIPVCEGSSVEVGDDVTLSVVITCLVVYGGMIFGKVRFYDYNQNLLSTSTAFTFDEYDTTGAFQSTGSVTVPASTAYLQIVFESNALSGSLIAVSSPSLTVATTSEATSAWTGAIPVATPSGPVGDGDAAYTGYDTGV